MEDYIKDYLADCECPRHSESAQKLSKLKNQAIRLLYLSKLKFHNRNELLKMLLPKQ